MYQLCERARQATGPVAMFVTLFGFWLLVSGHGDIQHLVAGAISALVVTWYWRSLLGQLVHRGDILPYRLLLCRCSPLYLLYLTGQIIRANIEVALVVLNPALPISPVVTRTRTYLRRDFTRVVFAQSITLTPGTLTLSLSGDRMVVHSLTEHAADLGSLDALETRVARIERMCR